MVVVDVGGIGLIWIGKDWLLWIENVEFWVFVQGVEVCIVVGFDGVDVLLVGLIFVFVDVGYLVG